MAVASTSKKKATNTVSPGLLKKSQPTARMHYSEDKDSGFTDCDESSAGWIDAVDSASTCT